MPEVCSFKVVYRKKTYFSSMNYESMSMSMFKGSSCRKGATEFSTFFVMQIGHTPRQPMQQAEVATQTKTEIVNLKPKFQQISALSSSGETPWPTCPNLERCQLRHLGPTSEWRSRHCQKQGACHLGCMQQNQSHRCGP